MNFYWLTEDKAVSRRYTGDVNASHKWRLPGAECSTCGGITAPAGYEFPCLDLSSLPERAEFEEPRAEPFEEFVRLRELVRPLAAGVRLAPGSQMGPLVGRASGRFGPIFWCEPWRLMMSRDVFEKLQAQGLRGLKGSSPELTFRQKKGLDLVELQIEPHGLLHPDCIPLEHRLPCPTCGSQPFRRPEEPILDGASLPEDLDLFRVANFSTMLVGTERFTQAVQRLNLEGFLLRELPVRSTPQ